MISDSSISASEALLVPFQLSCKILVMHEHSHWVQAARHAVWLAATYYTEFATCLLLITLSCYMSTAAVISGHPDYTPL